AGLDATRVDTEYYPVFTSNTIMRRPTQPKRLVIIGSGVIAMEFAHGFAAFGTEVTVLARGPRLLGDIDEEAADEFTRIFESTHTVLRGALANRLELAYDEVTLTLEPSGRRAEADRKSTRLNS